MKIESAFNILESRGMIARDERTGELMVTNENVVRQLLAKPSVSVYAGFDPTAPSLHVGHLLSIMGLAHLQRAGHRPLVLIGGATGMIGDPSGRSTERQLLTPDIVAENAQAIRQQLERFVSFEGDNHAVMVDNSDWIFPFSYVDWLRDVGKHFTINQMLAKESVRKRFEDREQGISYTEFSYMLLQAYDFLHLYDTHKCLIQIGGSDQWGNITSGIDLVRKLRRQEVYGFTFPLLTTASGEKFGKSAGNAVWLDPNMTSPYQFYQFWIRTDDRDVERYLKLLTFIELREIESLCEAHKKNPEQRDAQKVLAAEITRTVHGDEELKKARHASEVLFGKEITALSDKELSDIFADVPSTEKETSLLKDGLQIISLVMATKLAASKSEAQRLIKGGGVYLNNRRVASSDAVITYKDLASETMLVLRVGRNKYHLVRFV